MLLVPIPSTGLKQSHTHLGGAKLMGEWLPSADWKTYRDRKILSKRFCN